MNAAVEIERVGRTFRRSGEEITALRDVSLHIAQGEVVGLLGANGAGKTTLTKIIGTMLLPTSGTVRVFGTDVAVNPRTAREVTSVVLGGTRGLYGRLSGRENLEFFATLAGLPRRELRTRAERVTADFGLVEAAARPVETYSNGMRQRLHLAIGLVTRPRLLLLDEPTVGLDPIEAERLRGAVAGLRDSGVTILLTSHYLTDIERLADRAVLIADGHVAADMPVSRFRKLAGYAGVVTVRGPAPAPADLTDALDGATLLDVVTEDGAWTARLRVADWDGGVLRRLGELLGGMTVTDVEVAPVRLEDVYTHLVQAATDA